MKLDTEFLRSPVTDKEVTPVSEIAELSDTETDVVAGGPEIENEPRH